MKSIKIKKKIKKKKNLKEIWIRFPLIEKKKNFSN